LYLRRWMLLAQRLCQRHELEVGKNRSPIA
jgi:hypothetical protein